MCVDVIVGPESGPWHSEQPASHSGWENLDTRQAGETAAELQTHRFSRSLSLDLVHLKSSPRTFMQMNGEYSQVNGRGL
jgi:hypothetical protein